MPTYPQRTPTLTVAAYLKRPELLTRALTSLTYQRFVADRIFLQGSPESVAGGAVEYQQSESIFPDRDAETTAPRTEFPRASWTESVLTAVVEQHGLEIPINGLAVRRNRIDQLQRGLVKLSNAVVKYVDSMAITMLLAGAGNSAAGDSWATAGNAADNIAEVIQAVEDENEGYEVDTLIVNGAQHLQLMKDDDLRNAQPRESPANAIVTGRIAPFLGLRQILRTNTIPAGTALLMDSRMAGTIADEQPDPQEGYSSYVPSPDHRPIFVKQYIEDRSDDHIIRGVRWPAMWISEPGAIYKLTGLA